ncbi:MAG: ABC transporter permease [Dehalococcoidia bacterium]|nr:ABC transporter permease [Dehalococcoidia bacterium]
MTAASAFLLRDFRIAWSYRISFFTQNIGLLFSIVTLRFVSDLFGSAIPEELEQYGGDYFSFILLGAAINLLVFPLVNTFRNATRAAQVTGTLEALLATAMSPARTVLWSGLYPLMYVVGQTLLLLAVGIALGARYDPWAALPVLGVLALTIAAFSGLGLMSAAFTIVFKQNEPFITGSLIVSFMLAGVLYPTTVLPTWLEPVSQLLPLTHSLELLRGFTLGEGWSTGMAWHLGALGAFALLFPVGVWAVSQGITIATRRGTLSHY